MAEEASSPQASVPARPRRSSFAGQTFADLFGTGTTRQRPAIDGSTNGNSPSNEYSGPISRAAAQAQRRRLSLTTLGLSGSPGTSPYSSVRGRQDSIGSATSGSIDESAIEDDTAARDGMSTSMPSTPFARRMSFGARALRDVRTGGGSGGGGIGQNGTRSPPAASTNPSISAKTQTATASSRNVKGRGSADFWNENIRARTERTSLGGSGGIGAGGGGSVGGAANTSTVIPEQPSPPPMHTRAKSIALMERPIREREPPDHFQERILKGDFSWD